MSQQRHTVIVKDQFQHRIILQTVLMTFIVLNIFITLGFLLPEPLSSLNDPDAALAAIIAVLELIGLGVVYLIGRRLSFRIAGPIYAIEKSIKRMADGDLNIHVALRKDDYFLEVSDSVNKAIDHFHLQIEEAKTCADRLRESIAEDDANSPVVDELIQRLAYFDTAHQQSSDGDNGKGN